MPKYSMSQMDEFIRKNRKKYEMFVECFPVKQTKSYIKSVRTVPGSFNSDTAEKPEYLLDIGYGDGDLIPMYENQELDAKLEDKGDYFMVYVRRQGIEKEWEELGIVEKSNNLTPLILDFETATVKVDGGSHMRLVEGSSRKSLTKEWIPFQYTLRLKYKRFEMD